MNKDHILYCIKLAVAAFFLFGFGFIPPMEPITPLGMQVIGIFIGTIYLVSAVHPAWPGLLGIALLATTPLYTMSSAITTSFGNWLPQFLMAIFIMGYALVESGIAKKLVMNFVSLPILKGRPWLFTTFFLLSAIIIGYIMDCFALIAFYMGCIEIICSRIGYKKGDSYPTGLAIGVSFMIAIAGASTPFQSNVTFVLGQYAEFVGSSIPVLSYISWSIVPMLCIFGIYMLVFRFIIKPDVSKFCDFDFAAINTEKGALTKEQKRIAIIYMVVVIVWVLPGILQLLGTGDAIVTFLNGMGVTFPAFLGVVAMCACRADGKPLLNIKDATKNISWNIIILVAANMILANALGKDEVGFTAWFKQVFSPIVGDVSPLLFVAFIALVTLIMTNLGSNAVAAVISFQMASLLVPVNLNLAVVTVIVAFCTRSAYCLPSSCASLSTLYGDEWCNTKRILPMGILMCIATILVMMVVGYPLALIIFK